MTKEKWKRFLLDESSGAATMIEGMIMVLFTLFIVIAFISMGFMFYQQLALNIAANDIAREIGGQYKLMSTSDDPNTAANEAELPLYRTTWAKGKLEEQLCANANTLIKERIKLVTLGMDTEVTLLEDEFEVVTDGIGRMHVVVPIQMKCNILFGGALQFFDIINDVPTFQAVGRAECMDISAYAGHVHFFQYINEKIKNSDFNDVWEKLQEISRNLDDIMTLFGL